MTIDRGGLCSIKHVYIELCVYVHVMSGFFSVVFINSENKARTAKLE